jgi:hypothetical protein
MFLVSDRWQAAFTSGKMILDRDSNVRRELQQLLEKPDQYIVVHSRWKCYQYIAVIVCVRIEPQAIGERRREIIQSPSK